MGGDLLPAFTESMEHKKEVLLKKGERQLEMILKGAVAEAKVCNSSFFCANFSKKYRTRKNIDKNPEDGLSNKQKKREFQKIQNLVKKQGIKDGKPISRCCT